jgi:methylmalonyl-CoA/ethylmalonyl-CoA epimerase
MELEHIGIAVTSLEKAIPVFEKLMRCSCYKTEKVETEQVDTAFLSGGSVKVELIQAAFGENAISKFISRRGEGLHHIAFEVDDIRSEMLRLAAAGFELVDQEPRKGADQKLVCFIRPQSVHGVLIELCQQIP